MSAWINLQFVDVLDATTLELIFSAFIDLPNSPGIADPASYAFNFGLVCTAVAYDNVYPTKRVTLTTSQQIPQMIYTLAVDLAAITGVGPPAASPLILNEKAFAGFMPASGVYVVGSEATDTATLVLSFNDAMDGVPANMDPSNYTFDNGLTALSVVVSGWDLGTLILTTSQQWAGEIYTLTINDALVAGQSGPLVSNTWVFLGSENEPPSPPAPAEPTDLNVFSLDLGTKQGRIPHASIPGVFVVELGHAAQIMEAFVDPSMNEVSQVVTVAPGTKLLRARVQVRTPTHVPEGLYFAGGWRFEALLDDIVFYSRQLRHDGRTYTLHDIAVSAATAYVPRTLILRLYFLWFGGA